MLRVYACLFPVVQFSSVTSFSRTSFRCLPRNTGASRNNGETFFSRQICRRGAPIFFKIWSRIKLKIRGFMTRWAQQTVCVWSCCDESRTSGQLANNNSWFQPEATPKTNAVQFYVRMALRRKPNVMYRVENRGSKSVGETAASYCNCHWSYPQYCKEES